MNAIDTQQLDEIAEAFSKAIRQGKCPSIDDYALESLESQKSLRGILESIAMIEGLKGVSNYPTAAHRMGTSKIDRLGDYRIIREIGRGGMGIVFEAMHESLGRRVAIKVLSQCCLSDPRKLARFKREARSAAKLRHENIVPVFGAGYQDPIHYYVMDFIDGMSLHKWLSSTYGNLVDESSTKTNATTTIVEHSDCELRQLVQPVAHDVPSVTPNDPEYPRWVARIAEAVCHGLAHAHSQGVLHRDIKPANLILDRRGQVWIADFGLAKLIEPNRMTITGELVGTPQYMAPECFDGHYDEQSEVYSVGLTVYELLTGLPAIQGRRTAEVIRRATESKIESPSKLVPNIPRDLEAIVMKSLSPDPASRYHSAEAMREDLERFLSHRSISARRFGVVERTVRWSRREPRVAALTVATFLSLLTLVFVSATAFWKTRVALDDAQTATLAAESSLKKRSAALREADIQAMRAEANLHLALNAFDQIMQNMVDRGLPPDCEYMGDHTDAISPHVSAEDALLLQSLLEFFDELAANNSEDLWNESALAAQRAGQIYFHLGRLKEAERTLNDALRRFQQIAVTTHASSIDDGSIIAQAEILNDLTLIAGLRGEFDTALSRFEQAIGLLETTSVDSSAIQFAGARAYRLYASLGARIGLDDAIRPAAGPRGLARRPMANLVKIRTEDEFDAVEQAIWRLERLTEKDSRSVPYQVELARALRDRAMLASRANRTGISEQSIRRSIDVLEQLLIQYPDSKAVRYELACTLSCGEASGAGQIMRARRADALSTELLAHSPSSTRYQILKAQTLEKLASQQMRRTSFDAAEQTLTNAIEIYASLMESSPELTANRSRYAHALETLAELSVRKGSHDAAVVQLTRAIDVLLVRSENRSPSPIARIHMQRLRLKRSRIQERNNG